jgi:peroxiredoxin
LESRSADEPRQTRTAVSRPTALAIGSIAPPFELPSLDGPDVSLSDLMAAGQPVLLLSIDPACGPCTALLPDVAAWQGTSAGALTVGILSRGSPEANRGKLQPFGIKNVLLQKNQEVAEQYHTIATPSAVLIDPEGQVASAVVAGPEAIRRLVDRARHPVRRTGAIPIGTPAPAIALPDLDGVLFDLQGRAGQPTVLLFWNPTCGFCRRLLPHLAAWEAGRPDETGLVLLSEGSIEQNSQMGLRSAILLADNFAVGRSFGATGTPSAVLIDAFGRVASALTVGGPGVLALLNRLEPIPTINQPA